MEEGFADPVVERQIETQRADQRRIEEKPDAAELERIRQRMMQTAAQVQQRADQHPDNLAVQNSASRFALQNGDMARARQLADRAVELAEESGDPEAIRRTTLTRSMAKAANKDYDGACEDAQGVLKTTPRDATALEMKVFNCDRHNIKDRPAAKPDQWLAQQAPQVPHTPEEWAKRQGDEQTKAFQAIVKSMEARKAGDLAGALRAAEAAVAADVNDPMAWAQRGLVRSDMNDINNAVLDLSSALAMGMVWNTLYNLRAKALLKAKRYEAALDDAEISVGMDPKDASAYAMRAAAKKGAGMAAAQVLADFKAAAELDPAYQAAYEKAAEDLKLSGEQSLALANRDAAQPAAPARSIPWRYAAGAAVFLVLLVVLLRRR